MSLTSQEIFQQLSAAFPEVELKFDEAVPGIIVPAAAIKEVCLQLRDAGPFKFDTLMCLSGMDYADGNLGVVYHLFSMTHKHKATVKVIVPKADPHVETVEKVWRAADWHEREAYDLVGVIFDNHRDLRRILCPYDWEGHPLQKDYETPEYYNGMKVPY
jgi:NADH-quinone oxidoreductase subunit C